MATPCSFHRDLTIEGDTEAVLALRNALDDAEIDFLYQIAQLAGPFSGPVESDAKTILSRLRSMKSASGNAMIAWARCLALTLPDRRQETEMTDQIVKPMELVCPAGTPAALRTAVDAGADTVYAVFVMRPMPEISPA